MAALRKTYVTDLASAQQLILDINALEMLANKLGLFPASRALNNAKNAAGWQLAGNIEKADEAATYRL